MTNHFGCETMMEKKVDRTLRKRVWQIPGFYFLINFKKAVIIFLTLGGLLSDSCPWLN